jgi:hypothetical protein
MSADVWAALVDRHAPEVWQLAVAAGLDVAEAATVSQLVWLRMAERWPTVQALTTAGDGAEQLDGWIRETVGIEVRAWIDHSARLQREGALASPTVVRLAPGFDTSKATGSVGSSSDGGLSSDRGRP